MPDYKLISADSHVSEPPDLWATRVDQKYRERAPQLMVNPPGKEGAYFHYEGFAPHPIGIGLGAGKSPEELKMPVSLHAITGMGMESQYNWGCLLYTSPSPRD